MKFEPLSFEHQPLLQEKFRSLALCLSEYSFASRYLFRREYDYHVAFDEEMVWLRGKGADGAVFLMPTENLQKIPAPVLLEKLKWADCFYPIPEHWISSFSPEHFQASYNRNDSDYLFKRKKIAEYPGRNLSPKRNLVKQFRDFYTPEVFPYGKEHFKAALSVLNDWQAAFEGKKTDFLPCQDGLTYLEKLGLSGLMVYIHRQPAAFILGEVLRPTHFDVHFSKGLTIYKGIYPFLFKELANHLSSQEISCLNWEQDLGQVGLRQSKLSYRPDKIAHKYRISIRKKA